MERPFTMDDGNDCTKLFEAVINTQKDLIVLIEDTRPVVFNKAFMEFADVSGPDEFLREFGPLPSRFVPHGDYFHSGKVAGSADWTDAIMELPENDRIVSMLSCRIEPYAFSVTVAKPTQRYTIVTFTDISQDLIKRIMIENDISIDKASGAYDREYFLHTSKSFQEAAKFNKQQIGITIIELVTDDRKIDQAQLRDFTFGVKSSIRQSDMLVRWGEKTFLLAFFVNVPENAPLIGQKLLNVICHEPYESLNNVKVRLGSAVQTENEEISSVIYRAETAQRQSEEIHVITL